MREEVHTMVKRWMAWLTLVGLIGTVAGTGAALAGDSKSSAQCPTTQRCPCGK
jgi:hypothetical protein